MGRFGQQPEGEILPADCRGPEAAGGGDFELGAPFGCGPADSGDGVMLHRLRSFFRKGRVESELDAELRFHLEKQVEWNIRRGMNPREARYAAMRTFGGVEQVKEECRDARGLAFLETLMRDIRCGLRMMRKNP